MLLRYGNCSPYDHVLLEHRQRQHLMFSRKQSHSVSHLDANYHFESSKLDSSAHFLVLQ